MRNNEANDNFWGMMQAHLGYSDEELEKFKNDERNKKIFEKQEELIDKTIIFEVVESHGCNVNHKVGDKFLFSAVGFMLAHKGPERICPYIMPPMIRMMAVIQERIYEGLDPRPLFSCGQCDDVGIDCGGWGRVIVEPRIVLRE